jgi:hypothetical protein
MPNNQNREARRKLLGPGAGIASIVVLAGSQLGGCAWFQQLGEHLERVASRSSFDRENPGTGGQDPGPAVAASGAGIGETGTGPTGPAGPPGDIGNMSSAEPSAAAAAASPTGTGPGPGSGPGPGPGSGPGPGPGSR